jgi:DNA-binding IclR family transcriptional regulator
MSGNSADAGRSVTSKVIAILLTFGDGTVYSLTEIARLAGLPISTTHRLVIEMAAWGLLERAEAGQYRVGMQLQMIASEPAGRPLSVRQPARRVMEDLSAAAPASTVRLGVLDGGEVAYIEKAGDNHPVSMCYEPTTLPAHATAMGKALLAFSEPEVVDEVIEQGLDRYTPFTLTSADRLRRALATIRLTRVAMCRRELHQSASAVAVPAFGPGGGVVAALELAVAHPQDFRMAQPPLIVAARRLSRELHACHPSAPLSRDIEAYLKIRINRPGALVSGNDRRAG